MGSTNILLWIIIIAAFAAAVWWHVRENAQLIRILPKKMDEELAQKLIRFAHIRTAQLLLAIIFSAFILAIYESQLNETRDSLDQLTVAVEQKEALEKKTAAAHKQMNGKFKKGNKAAMNFKQSDSAYPPVIEDDQHLPTNAPVTSAPIVQPAVQAANPVQPVIPAAPINPLQPAAPVTLIPIAPNATQPLQQPLVNPGSQPPAPTIPPAGTVTPTTLPPAATLPPATTLPAAAISPLVTTNVQNSTQPAGAPKTTQAVPAQTASNPQVPPVSQNAAPQAQAVEKMAPINNTSSPDTNNDLASELASEVISQQQEVTSAAATKANATANTVNDLYNPERNGTDVQSNIDDIKKRYEDVLVIYMFLKKCGKVKPTDYNTITSAMGQEMASVNAPGHLQTDILSSAQGSYQEIYAQSPCDGTGITALNAQYRDYLKALNINFPAQ